MPAATERELLGLLDQGNDLPPIERALLLAAAAGVADPGALPIGERDRAILGLRVAVLGSRLEGTDPCPSCHELTSFALSAADLTSSDAAPGTVTVESHGYTVVCRPPTTDDLRRALAADAPDPGRALLATVVLSATSGPAPVPAADLPLAVTEAVANRLSESDPLADVQLLLSCETCGADWLAPLDIADFAWHELRRWYQRALWEVHALARAYGWTEAEVLAVPPARRRIYLEWIAHG